LILHGLNNTMAMIFSFSEAGDGGVYIWNGHVAPWIIIIALACVITGFRGINSLRVQA
jgi:hypothetical protein